jgi:ABC-2 type transport system permease protein
MKPAAFLKLTWLELKLFVREPLAVLFTLGFPLVFMFVIAGVFNIGPGGSGNPFRGVGGAEYYVVSNIGVVIGAMGLIALPVHMAAYVERGILRRFRASSVPVGAVVLAQALVSFIVAIAATAVLLLAARPVYTYHLPHSLPGVVIGFVIGLLSFLAIGLLIAGLFPSTRSAQGVGFIAFFPLWLLSGAGPPIAVLPDTMRHLADFLPLAYAVRALQDPWFGYGITEKNLVILVGIGIVAGIGSVALYRRR